MRTSIRVSDTASPVLKAARRELSARVKEGMTAAAEEIALPRVKRVEPQILQTAFVAKATARGAFITTRGSRVLDRIAGLLEFGGTVASKIVPTKKRALLTPWGPRAAVYRGTDGQGRPGRYAGKELGERAIQASYPAFEAAALPHIMRAFDGAEVE